MKSLLSWNKISISWAFQRFVGKKVPNPETGYIDKSAKTVSKVDLEIVKLSCQ